MVDTLTIKAILLHLWHVRVETAALMKVLRDRGISMNEIDASISWAADQMKDARLAIEAIDNEVLDTDVEKILRGFQGPVQ